MLRLQCCAKLSSKRSGFIILKQVLKMLVLLMLGRCITESLQEIKEFLATGAKFSYFAWLHFRMMMLNVRSRRSVRRPPSRATSAATTHIKLCCHPRHTFCFWWLIEYGIKFILKTVAMCGGHKLWNRWWLLMMTVLSIGLGPLPVNIQYQSVSGKQIIK